METRHNYLPSPPLLFLPRIVAPEIPIVLQHGSIPQLTSYRAHSEDPMPRSWQIASPRAVAKHSSGAA
ncbi:unnamed protein product [Penicillium roqueforti FM164]|uniref:Genomic scaffold, ProqFM164S01 n=1 Tax=Penicillium roqueforti (strain FM164) TaxID=1365484 RepID=W6PWS7_PENRF|nr:unnamed protein product [Penicillium roqueforti FM164]